MAAIRRARFSPADRLLRRGDFLRVYDEGRRVREGGFLLFYLRNDAGRHRLGVTVPSRLGGAVQRNRVKRWLREIFRHNRQALGGVPLDVVLNVSEGGIGAGQRRLQEAFFRAAGVARAGRGQPPRRRARTRP